ncbi:unnamed protein product [Dibothriocephalus latus]|uniref:Uncharacterized protein n=1 Tax=Dibothriocephalus latus TaxID=60516 RepID=A0A3P7NLW1_DIBLA|nr:unnamed protein product [Dibothriocephalus latus]
MFYDVDYDFFVDAADMKSTFGILAKLSANASTEMRFIGARRSFGLPKLGLMCGNDGGWKKREDGALSYVVCASMEATRQVLKPCLFYVDFYWMRRDSKGSLSVNSLKTKFAVKNVLSSDYRPMDGTLFKSVGNFDGYAEIIYGSPIYMCVPKNRNTSRKSGIVCGKWEKSS